MSNLYYFQSLNEKNLWRQVPFCFVRFAKTLQATIIINLFSYRNQSWWNVCTWCWPMTEDTELEETNINLKHKDWTDTITARYNVIKSPWSHLSLYCQYQSEYFILIVSSSCSLISIARSWQLSTSLFFVTAPPLFDWLYCVFKSWQSFAKQTQLLKEDPFFIFCRWLLPD